MAKSKRKIATPKTVHEMALGGHFQIYRSSMIANGRYINVRNGEAGHCAFHTDPQEMRALGEFLIAMSQKTDNEIDAENGV